MTLSQQLPHSLVLLDELIYEFSISQTILLDLIDGLVQLLIDMVHLVYFGLLHLVLQFDLLDILLQLDIHVSLFHDPELDFINIIFLVGESVLHILKLFIQDNVRLFLFEGLQLVDLYFLVHR